MSESSIISEIVCQKQHDCVFVRHKDKSLYYNALRDSLADMRAQFPHLSGQVVLLIAPDCLEVILVHLLCWTDGAVLVPVSPSASETTLSHIISKIKPFLVITTQSLYIKNQKHFLEYQCLLLNNKYKIILPERYNKTITGIDPEDISLILFTSGTTGIPKGVCLSKESILNASNINSAIMQLDKSRKSLVTVPLYDYYGIIQIYSHLLTGNSFIIGESGLFPKSAFSMMKNEMVTDLVLVPYTLRKLRDYIERIMKSEDILSTLRQIKYIASSSDILTPELVNAVFQINSNITIINVYGLTEVGRAIYKEIKKETTDNMSIGRATPGMSVRIENQENGKGEIVIRGTTVMKGYLQNIENGKIYYDSQSEIWTGDIGFYDNAGDIFLIGRKDHLLNINGIKLHPNEIEQPLIREGIVNDCLVSIDINTDSGEPSVSLKIIKKSDQNEMIREKIIETLRNRIPRIFMPEKIEIVDNLERTELGSKLKRPKANPI